MAHFAEIDENNNVIRVLVVPNEQEHRGHEYLADDCALGGTWIQTSYNHRIRGTFASVGSTYDPDRDIFILPKPYPSWVLDEDGKWQAPIPRPEDAPIGSWNEETQTWEISNG